jgi:hypothetical protein
VLADRVRGGVRHGEGDDVEVHGPLFQIGLAKDKTKLLDIGQTSDHKADMTTWSAFCSGSTSNCVVSKIYAQIHTGPNDLVPGVFKTPWNPDCSAGGFTCAGKFTIESATGLPMVTTDSPQEYSLSGDNFATGINGGLEGDGHHVPRQADPQSGLLLRGHRPHPQVQRERHRRYGLHGRAGVRVERLGRLLHCRQLRQSNSYCVGAEEEENNDLYDYGTSPLENAVVVTQFDPTPNAVITHLNGKQVLMKSPPKQRSTQGPRSIWAAGAI